MHSGSVNGGKQKDGRRSLAAKQIRVVYGGSRFGLLGSMADAVVANGGGITGILPEFFTSMH